ncbi:MAG: hypothetical protein ACRDTG_20355 [Pseudonocardiaceae bacterium]
MKAKSVNCPPGKVVIGGGGAVIGGFGNVALNWLTPVKGTNSFEARATRATPNWGGSWQLSVYAICSNPIPGLEFVSVTTAGDVTASCPSDKKVIGTGGRVNGGPVTGEVVLEDVRPADDLGGVLVRAAADPVSVVTWNVTAIAICVPPIAGQQLVKSPAGNPSAVVSCPVGTKVHSTAAKLNTGWHGHIVLNDLIPNVGLTSVSASAFGDVHNPPPASWSINSYAICVT